ncbi:MAG: hypothetical protein FWC43_10360 [Planctomycetaceae bacterium]|nr:hypothetical protein [Planctomycetaceae bacterium]
MKTLFGFFGIAMFMVGFSGFMAESVYSQYLPPAIGNAFQSGTVPNFVNPEKKPELKPVQENQSSKFTYRQYEDEFQVPTQQIIITPVADPKSGAQPTVVLSNSPEPQQVPGMTAQTIYYFPPPSFPDPIPLTVYRPAAPQPQQFPQPGGEQPNWSPYNSMLYGPPMITQPHYFGPPKQEKGHRFHKKNPGNPGEPVVGPPVLVYPNGIVVRPKVYLPQQPFKNVVRAMTP